MNYEQTFYYGSEGMEEAWPIFLGFGLFWLFLVIAFSIFMAICLHKVFEKQGKNGWIAIVPIYNMWVLLEMVDLPGWLILIPGANAIVTMIAYYKLSELFGKSSSYGLGLAFLPYIFLPILAFEKENQKIPASSSKANKFCPSCGKEVTKKSAFCQSCGNKL